MAFNLDGSSLAAFSYLGSASAFSISTAIGNPAPSIAIANASFDAAIFQDTAFIWGTDGFEFDVQLASGATSYIYLLCDAAGNGPLLSLSNGGTTGLRLVTTYTQSTPTTNALFVTAEQNVTYGVFVKYRAYIRLNDTSYQVRIVRVDATLGEVLCLDWTTFVPKGYYFGLLARGFGVSYVDNMRSFRTSSIAGVATLSNGSPASLVKCYSMVSGQDYLVDSATPDDSGNYTLSVNTGDYLVVAIGPSGYRPQAHLVTAP